jgi:hypothetical protein
MSDLDLERFTYEGGPDEPEPAVEQTQDDEQVLLVSTGALRGGVFDSASGLQFSTQRPTAVPAEHVERLLDLKSGGRPVLVRAD